MNRKKRQKTELQIRYLERKLKQNREEEKRIRQTSQEATEDKTEHRILKAGMDRRKKRKTRLYIRVQEQWRVEIETRAKRRKTGLNMRVGEKWKRKQKKVEIAKQRVKKRERIEKTGLYIRVIEKWRVKTKQCKLTTRNHIYIHLSWKTGRSTEHTGNQKRG